jgi:hypothetical protein
MKVTTRKASTTPETSVRGSGPAPGTGDQHLEKLEAEAAKTGDRTAVIAYKRKMREAAEG